MKQYIVIFFIFISFFGFAQNTDKISELNNKLADANSTEKVGILIELSKEYGFTSFKLSEKYAKQAEKYALKLKLDTALINIYRLIGASKQYQNQLDSAIYFFNKSIDYSKKINDEYELAKSSSNLGTIYASDKQFDKAEKIYLASLEILLKSNDTNAISHLYNNLGMVYRLKHNFEKALNYYEKALVLTKKNSVEYAMKLSNIAEVYHLQKKNDLAVQQYLKAIKIFEEKNSKYNIAYNYKRIADLYFEQDNNEKSKLYCLQSIEIAKDIDAKNILLYAYELIIKIERKNNNLESALRYSDSFTKLNNEINKIKRDKLLNELKVQYNVELKDTEIANNKLVIKEKNKFLWVLSIGAIVFLLLIILLSMQLFKIKSAYKNLATQNMDAVAAEEELIELKQNIIKENLTDTDSNELIDKILHKIEIEKAYTNPNLTIFTFADELETNKTYVSQEINSRFNKNFSNFINDYRVSEARRLMTMPENHKLTLAAIAEKAGFNSISVFNRSFKRVTGITPSYFLKQVKNK